MQTFLPYPNFKETARCLDRQRLGKQRIEAYQLVMLMFDQGRQSWRNHPAFKMWDGNDISLIRYGITICNEWISRGYKDTMKERFILLLNSNLPYNNQSDPNWLGDKLFHASHRSNLLRKNHNYYKQFGWTESDNLPYIWPINEILV
jgi:hypothetical protein